MNELKARKTQNIILKLKRDLIQIQKDLDCQKQSDSLAFDLEAVLPVEILKKNPSFKHLQEDALPVEAKYMKMLNQKIE